MGDTGTGIYGVYSNTEVFGMTDVNGALVIVGSFTQLSNGSTCRHICSISNPYVFGTNQVYNEFGGGVSDKVYAIYHDSTTDYTHFGGDFTIVDLAGSPVNMFFGAYYYNLGGAWQNGYCFNNLNGPVYVIKPTAYSISGVAQIFVAGAFTSSPTVQIYSTFVDNTDPYNVYTDSGITLVSAPSYKQAYGLGSDMAVMNGLMFYYLNSSGVWNDLGDPVGTGAVSGISNFAGNWKVIYDSYGFIRSHLTAPHSCEFQGSFVYDATPYTTYAITKRNVSQQFIGDLDCSFWSIIGQGVGAFS